MTIRALTCCLAASLWLGGCKSDDKPKTSPEPAAEKAVEVKDQAADTVDQALDKAGAAADQAKSAVEEAREKARVAGEMAKAAGELAKDHAIEAINDAKTLRDMLTAVDGQINTTMEEMTNAPSEAALNAAKVTLEKLKQEHKQIADRIAALKDARAP